MDNGDDRLMTTLELHVTFVDYSSAKPMHKVPFGVSSNVHFRFRDFYAFRPPFYKTLLFFVFGTQRCEHHQPRIPCLYFCFRKPSYSWLREARDTQRPSRFPPSSRFSDVSFPSRSACQDLLPDAPFRLILSRFIRSEKILLPISSEP